MVEGRTAGEGQPDFDLRLEPNETESRPEKKETKEFPGVQQVVVKGSMALAMKLGRDISLARDLDICFIQEDQDVKPTLQSFANLDQVKAKLPPEEYALIAEFVTRHGLERYPIQVNRATEKFIEETSLFENEPSVILWDAWLEANSSLYNPLPLEEKKRLLEKLETMRGNLNWAETDRMEAGVETAHDLYLYQHGLLMNGRAPDYLEPAHDYLSTGLRLADLGQRFGIHVDDSMLMAAEAQAAAGKLEIAIPPERPDPETLAHPVGRRGSGEDEEDFSDDDEESDDDEDYFTTPRAIKPRSEPGHVLDSTFLTVAERKDLIGILRDEYPHLAEVTEAIWAKGGIREYVAETYGPGYLQWDSLPMGAFKFSSELGAAEQTSTLTIWKDANDEFRNLFQDKFETFVERWLKVRTPELSTASLPKIRETVLRSQFSDKLDSEDIYDRKTGYESLYYLANDNQERGLRYVDEYQATKELIKESLSRESNKTLRKSLVDYLVRLSTSGEDTVIASDFADQVRQESTERKTRKAAKKEILTPEGMMALRGLLRLEHEDSTRAIWELVANPAIDPRLKKICLRNLYQEKSQFLKSDLSEVVRGDLAQPAKGIPWEDYAMINRIKRISSTTVRERLENPAYESFQKMRLQGRSLASMNAELGPDLAPEFFLPLMAMMDGDEDQIKKWDHFIGAIKSTKVKENFLYNLANMVEYDQATARLLTDKIIDAPQVTKERIAVADRLLKKIHSLVFFRNQTRGTRANHCGNPNCTSCGPRKERKEMPDVRTMLQNMKAPSLLEVELDQQIVSNLYELTGREDLTSDRIQGIFNAWEDPEPMFVFTSQLAGGRGTARGRRSLDLVGDMLAHMDPPHYDEWKQWRYSTEDEFGREQLAGLTPEQIAAYAEDEFTDLGEVLVGLLPSDKPGRIQHEIVHALRHDWQQGDNPLGAARELTAAVAAGERGDITEAAERDLQLVERDFRLIDRRLGLVDNLQLLERLPQQLAGWQRAEQNKKTALKKLGYRGDETRSEVEERISELQRTDPTAKEITALATLKPGEVPPKAQAMLDRFELSVTASQAEVQELSATLAAALAQLEASDDYRRLGEERFPGVENVSNGQWREVMKELKGAQILLKLSNLTPQRIAFNKISDDKKKATLSTSLDYLRRNFSRHESVNALIGRVETIIQESGQSVGKDRLAVIYTDNPMAMLTIGRFPNGATSCQNYQNGDRVLAAYMGDAYTKTCLLVDLNKLPPEVNAELEQAADSQEKMKVFQGHTFAFLNASVGRRLTKIVQGVDDKQPKLFLEPVYTPMDRQSTTRLMNAFAVTHLAPKLNLPLVRGGGSAEVSVSESRNGSQYEDGEYGGPGGAGGGLGTQEGEYRMTAQPLEPKDYAVE